MRVRIQHLVLAAALVGVGIGARATATRETYTTEDVTWTSGDVRLAGTLYLPRGSDRVPALVLLHGSGQMGRLRNAGNKVLFNHAEWFASNGIAVLFYDKRGVGKSTGDFRLAGFDVLTADAAGGLALLRRHPRVDSTRVGTFGVSQGPWLATQLVEAGESLAFHVFLTGGPPVTPAEQDLFVEANEARRAGAPAAEVDDVLALVRQAQSVYRADSGWEALASRVARMRERPWWGKARIAIARREDAWWPWFRSFMDYDPRPTLRELAAPVFAAYGGDDQVVDAVRGEGEWAQIRAEARADITTRTYPGAGHSLRSGNGTSQPDAYWRDLKAWLQAQKIIG